MVAPSHRRVALAALILAAIGLVLLGVSFLLRVTDTSSHYEYATYADVQKDKSIHAATVPSFVPRSAREIVGSYNVEFNTQMLEFRFNPEDQALMTSEFHRASNDEAQAIQHTLHEFRWKGTLPSNTSAIAFVRRGTNTVEYLVIDVTNARVFYAVKH